MCRNLENLKKHDVKDSSENEEMSVKAGQVIISAKPFVFTPSTRYVLNFQQHIPVILLDLFHNYVKSFQVLLNEHFREKRRIVFILNLKLT